MLLVLMAGRHTRVGRFVNVPEEARRIVVPVGSGLSLAGVLTGLQLIGQVVPVLGVVVGPSLSIMSVVGCS